MAIKKIKQDILKKQSLQYSEKARYSQNFIKVIFYAKKILFTFDMPSFEYVHI